VCIAWGKKYSTDADCRGEYSRKELSYLIHVFMVFSVFNACDVCSYLINVFREGGQPAQGQGPPPQLMGLHVHLEWE
jgi:hypothetical protein